MEVSCFLKEMGAPETTDWRIAPDVDPVESTKLVTFEAIANQFDILDQRNLPDVLSLISRSHRGLEGVVGDNESIMKAQAIALLSNHSHA